MARFLSPDSSTQKLTQSSQTNLMRQSSRLNLDQLLHRQSTSSLHSSLESEREARLNERLAADAIYNVEKYLKTKEALEAKRRAKFSGPLLQSLPTPPTNTIQRATGNRANQAVGQLLDDPHFVPSFLATKEDVSGFLTERVLSDAQKKRRSREQRQQHQTNGGSSTHRFSTPPSASSLAHSNSSLSNRGSQTARVLPSSHATSSFDAIKPVHRSLAIFLQPTEAEREEIAARESARAAHKPSQHRIKPLIPLAASPAASPSSSIKSDVSSSHQRRRSLEQMEVTTVGPIVPALSLTSVGENASNIQSQLSRLMASATTLSKGHYVDPEPTPKNHLGFVAFDDMTQHIHELRLEKHKHRDMQFEPFEHKDDSDPNEFTKKKRKPISLVSSQFNKLLASDAANFATVLRKEYDKKFTSAGLISPMSKVKILPDGKKIVVHSTTSNSARRRNKKSTSPTSARSSITHIDSPTAPLASAPSLLSPPSSSFTELQPSPTGSSSSLDFSLTPMPPGGGYYELAAKQLSAIHGSETQLARVQALEKQRQLSIFKSILPSSPSAPIIPPPITVDTPNNQSLYVLSGSPLSSSDDSDDSDDEESRQRKREHREAREREKRRREERERERENANRKCPPMKESPNGVNKQLKPSASEASNASQTPSKPSMNRSISINKTGPYLSNSPTAAEVSLDQQQPFSRQNSSTNKSTSRVTSLNSLSPASESGLDQVQSLRSPNSSALLSPRSKRLVRNATEDSSLTSAETPSKSTTSLMSPKKLHLSKSSVKGAAEPSNPSQMKAQRPSYPGHKEPSSPSTTSISTTAAPRPKPLRTDTDDTDSIRTLPHVQVKVYNPSPSSESLAPVNEVTILPITDHTSGFDSFAKLHALRSNPHAQPDKSEKWVDALKARGGFLSRDDNRLLRDLHIAQTTPWLAEHNHTARVEIHAREFASHVSDTLDHTWKTTLLQRLDVLDDTTQAVTSIQNLTNQFTETLQTARETAQHELDVEHEQHRQHYQELVTAYAAECAETERVAAEAKSKRLLAAAVARAEEDRALLEADAAERLAFQRAQLQALRARQEAEGERRAAEAARLRAELERKRLAELEAEQARLAELARQEELAKIAAWDAKRMTAKRGILTMRIIRCDGLLPMPEGSKDEYRFGFQLRFNAANLPNSHPIYTPFFQTAAPFELGAIFNQEFKFEVNNAALQKMCIVMECIPTGEIDHPKNKEIATMNHQYNLLSASGNIITPSQHDMRGQGTSAKTIQEQLKNLQALSELAHDSKLIDPSDPTLKGIHKPQSLGLPPQYLKTKYGGHLIVPISQIRQQQGGILHQQFVLDATKNHPEAFLEMEFRLRPIFVQTKGGGGQQVLETMEHIEAELNKEYDPYEEKWQHDWKVVELDEEEEERLALASAGSGPRTPNPEIAARSRSVTNSPPAEAAAAPRMKRRPSKPTRGASMSMVNLPSARELMATPLSPMSPIVSGSPARAKSPTPIDLLSQMPSVASNTNDSVQPSPLQPPLDQPSQDPSQLQLQPPQSPSLEPPMEVGTLDTSAVPALDGPGSRSHSPHISAAPLRTHVHRRRNSTPNALAYARSLSSGRHSPSSRTPLRSESPAPGASPGGKPSLERSNSSSPISGSPTGSGRNTPTRSQSPKTYSSESPAGRKLGFHPIGEKSSTRPHKPSSRAVQHLSPTLVPLPTAVSFEPIEVPMLIDSNSLTEFPSDPNDDLDILPADLQQSPAVDMQPPSAPEQQITSAEAEYKMTLEETPSPVVEIELNPVDVVPPAAPLVGIEPNPGPFGLYSRLRRSRWLGHQEVNRDIQLEDAPNRISRDVWNNLVVPFLAGDYTHPYVPPVPYTLNCYWWALLTVLCFIFVGCLIIYSILLMGVQASYSDLLSALLDLEFVYVGLFVYGLCSVYWYRRDIARRNRAALIEVESDPFVIIPPGTILQTSADKIKPIVKLYEAETVQFVSVLLILSVGSLLPIGAHFLTMNDCERSIWYELDASLERLANCEFNPFQTV